ncbi:PREDICTED: myotubularin-related protein 9-like [Priapulus caudatus]|uniref:Myotubularin-related protein 9-like n=1 Tax=Priapulus caudatus TaxID=37621 RepID=A0ABM1DX58_PRICU|nr:PREDICTED: myotubularin-related protein 9-like [Priapulus caudatus]XP_014664529.1 PREDICTED: myotubularin-related protein 9-like [Priapulus caudatus]
MEFVELIKTPKVDGVVLNRPFQEPVDGTLCVTGHHLILSSRTGNHEELWLLHRNIDCIEKRLEANRGTVIVKCKNFQVLRLDIPGQDETFNIAGSIEVLSSLEDVSLWYPFYFRPRQFDIMEDGWQAFQVDSELTRLISHADHSWRISSVNKDFSVCPTYPAAVAVPKSVSDELLLASAGFRDRGRFPVLSYYHNDNGAVIMRSGQPLVGTSGRRSKEDEQLLNASLRAGKKGYIIDTRSPSVAQMAKSRGGGWEPEANYSQWKRVHRAMERHTVLQEALCKLIEACSDSRASTDKWLSRLDSSGWLSHIKDVLTCACLTAQCVDKEGASVLVHGTEGTESTLQVTSLAQVILDPDCRTVRGFEALVEREWVQAGHPFNERCGKSAFSNVRSRYEAPVFLLFLDSVWQVCQQFPCSFEFNTQFLILLFEHAYASQFGTFLCNSEAEKTKLGVHQKTVSLWSWLNRPEVLQNYLNPMYEPNKAVIWPSVAPQSLELWSELYLRWSQDNSTQQETIKHILSIKEHNKELRTKVIRMRRQLLDLQKEAVDRGLLAADGNSMEVASEACTSPVS